MSATKSLQTLLDAEIATNEHRMNMRDSGNIIAQVFAEQALESIREKLVAHPDYLNYVISA